MKVGINLPSQFPMESTNQMMEVYEQVGFDSYWAPDHILGMFHPQLWGEVPLSAMGADPDGFYDPFVYGARLATMSNSSVSAHIPSDAVSSRMFRIRSPISVPPGSRRIMGSSPLAARWAEIALIRVVLPLPSGPSKVIRRPL